MTLGKDERYRAIVMSISPPRDGRAMSRTTGTPRYQSPSCRPDRAKGIGPTFPDTLS